MMASRRRGRQNSELDDDEFEDSANGSGPIRLSEVRSFNATHIQARAGKRQRIQAAISEENSEIDEGIEIAEIDSGDSGDESEVEATQRHRAQLDARLQEQATRVEVCSPHWFC